MWPMEQMDKEWIKLVGLKLFWPWEPPKGSC